MCLYLRMTRNGLRFISHPYDDIYQIFLFYRYLVLGIQINLLLLSTELQKYELSIDEIAFIIFDELESARVRRLAISSRWNHRWQEINLYTSPSSFFFLFPVCPRCPVAATGRIRKGKDILARRRVIRYAKLSESPVTSVSGITPFRGCEFRGTEGNGNSTSKVRRVRHIPRWRTR